MHRRSFRKKHIGFPVLWTVILTLMLAFHVSAAPPGGTDTTKGPRIVNIINFIRLLEPRDSAITEDVLYQTVVKQVEIMNRYHLKGSFLLQYDALMDSRYQQLLKTLPKDQYEIGGWWEIPQPLVENAGMKWRGQYPWDWRANIGFSTGYTQQERMKLIDTYMADFKKIFGYYPKSVGSWFIDAFSINYMYEKYHIVASCNCKDQYGTDGYTLWGGYWNQAYYPSKINAYMPAQNSNAQIPVPIFRMLGSDPIRQYDNALGNPRQGVVTLEPVYPFGGGDSTWVHWFFKQFVEGESLAFAYTQAGQENSFTWNGMAKGFEIQMPLIARLMEENKISVQTLAESGEWFKKTFRVTPATTVTVNNDVYSNKKTVWFNSRFYRVNVLWEDGSLRIRDIHLFDEKFPSVYEANKVDENECRFFTLPFVDGYIWSRGDTLAGMRLKANIDGKEVLLLGDDNPEIKEGSNGDLQLSWELKTVPGKLVVHCTERSISMNITGNTGLDWFFDLTTAANVSLPFKNIHSKKVECNFENFNYSVLAQQGTFTKPQGNAVLRLKPTGGKIILQFDEHK